MAPPSDVYIIRRGAAIALILLGFAAGVAASTLYMDRFITYTLTRESEKLITPQIQHCEASVAIAASMANAANANCASLHLQPEYQGPNPLKVTILDSGGAHLTVESTVKPR